MDLIILIMMLLIPTAATGGETGATPLHGAAFMGHVEAVKSLVEAGADVEARGNDVSTASDLTDNLRILAILNGNEYP